MPSEFQLIVLGLVAYFPSGLVLQSHGTGSTPSTAAKCLNSLTSLSPSMASHTRSRAATTFLKCKELASVLSLVWTSTCLVALSGSLVSTLATSIWTHN